MNYLKLLDMQALREVVIVANTPNFVFSRFRKNPSLGIFAAAVSEAELTKLIYTLAKCRTFTIDDLVILYASIIVLISARGFDISEKLKSTIASSRFRWLKELSDIVNEKVFPTTEITVQAPPRLSTSVDKSSQDANRTTIETIYNVEQREET